MRKFTCVNDIGALDQAVAEAMRIKADRFAWSSTQKAAMNLGMNVMVLDINQGAWKLETERGVVMDGDKAEHLLEAIPVMASYCDMIGVRAFAGLTDRDADYSEKVISQFVKYAGSHHDRRVQDKRAPQGGADMGSPSEGVAAGRGQFIRRVDAGYGL